jgi:hypothetical protein
MLRQERYGKGSWIVEYEFDSLAGEDQYDWEGKGLGDFKNAWTAQMAHLQVE